MTTLKDILALLAILASYGIAGRMDYDDAVRHEEYMRSRSAEQLICSHGLSAMNAEALAVDRNDLAAATANRDCETTPL